MADVGTLLFPTWSFYLVPWLLGFVAAIVASVVAILSDRPVHRAVALGILSVPVWDTLWGIIESFGPLLRGGVVLLPYSRHQLSGLFTYKFLDDLGYLILGVLVHGSGGTWKGFWSQTPRSVARHVRDMGLPMGRWLRGRGEGASAFTGLLLFPVLLFFTYGANLVLGRFQSLQQSDESSLFANMTPYHALLISLAAGFGEELLYRGVLQTALSRKVPVVLAIFVQGLFFGLAHSGYGTWIHVLLPTLFGLVAGLVAYAFGLWAAIVLHVLVDVIAFGLEASGNYDWVLPSLNGFVGANLLLTVGWAIAMLVVALQRRNSKPS